MSVAISLDNVLQQQVEHIAARRQLSFNGVIIQALREYVSREEKKMQFQQEAITAWQDFQQDGLHLTGDEVINWLDTWGTNAERQCPQCHK